MVLKYVSIPYIKKEIFGAAVNVRAIILGVQQVVFKVVKTQISKFSWKFQEKVDKEIIQSHVSFWQW